MRRFSTLSILAIFAPAMCVIAFAVFTVLEVLHVYKRGAKYRSGLPPSVEASFEQGLDDDVAYMIRHGLTPSEYAAIKKRASR